MLLTLLLTLVCVAALKLLAANLWMVWQAPPLHREPRAVPERPVAIVPGAGVRRDGSPLPVLEDRLAGALELYRAGRVRRILVSGDNAGGGHDEVSGMLRWLSQHGVPEAHLYSDHAGVRTLDTMERAARIFGVRAAVVCTQRFHLPRSLFLARRAGIDAQGLAVDRRRYRGLPYWLLREVLARPRALVDSYLLGLGPRYLGPPIPIDGPAEASRDPSRQLERAR